MPNNRTSPIPARLADARHEAGLTQEQAADRAGLSRTSIARYESGLVSPSPVSLNMLAVLYGKTVDWLLGREEEEQPPPLTEEEQAAIGADREMVMNEASLALRSATPNLSDTAIKAIADFIRFLDEREERERHERQEPRETT